MNVSSFVAAVLLTAATFPAMSQDANFVELGMEAYGRKDYKAAYEYFEAGAAIGMTTAYLMLGAFYDNGIYVQQDVTEGANWYLRAARGGHVYGQFNIGVAYANGEGVGRDPIKATMWLTIAAWRMKEQGDQEEVDRALSALGIASRSLSDRDLEIAAGRAQACMDSDYRVC